jgi:spore germination cell wall hydrolase CwlJ-like protein
MALPQADTTTPFQWGANGARMTPEDIAAQQKVAQAMMEKGSDATPLPTGTRGSGIWTQGLARVAKGIVGGYDLGEAAKASQANADDNKAMIATLLGGGAPAATAATAPTASISSAPAVASAAPVAAKTTGKIYSNDEPSPLDPPSGADRDNMIRTIYGEAGNEPTKGQLAVAAVIRNRAVDGGYGGNTPTAVVQAPNQFEPWNGGPAKHRMLALSPNDPKYAAISKVVDAAYGSGGREPEDPTEGKTMFYSPGAQAALGRAPPSWAKGEGQVIGGHTFYDDPDDETPAAPGAAVAKVAAAYPTLANAAAPAVVAPVQVAANDPAAIPAAATPTQGYAIPGQPAPAAAVSPAVAKVAGALNPTVLQALTSPYASEGTKKIATLLATQRMNAAGKEHFTQETDGEGNIWNVNSNGQKTIAKAVEKDPTAVKEFEYGQTHPDFVAQQLAKTKAGAAQLNNQNNIDTNSSQTYDKQLSEGLGKSHAALANGVEDAQTRARDIAGMQGAVDSIQKAGGTTGGMLPQSINAGAAALGIDKPFDESDIADKELLTKLNRQIAGAQAKGAVGSRVTNFEMSNYLKANAGLDMSLTGSQRILGVQGQVEQRNVDVGNAIRQATAQAISNGKKIDPVTVQKIITDYDEAHHIQDPITGQDLTKSYALPEFNRTGQGGTSNDALAATHAANVGKIRVWHPETGVAP